jgi:hypothetical protein
MRLKRLQGTHLNRNWVVLLHLYWKLVTLPPISGGDVPRSLLGGEAPGKLTLKRGGAGGPGREVHHVMRLLAKAVTSQR